MNRHVHAQVNNSYGIAIYSLFFTLAYRANVNKVLPLLIKLAYKETTSVCKLHLNKYPAASTVKSIRIIVQQYLEYAEEVSVSYGEGMEVLWSKLKNSAALVSCKFICNKILHFGNSYYS